MKFLAVVLGIALSVTLAFGQSERPATTTTCIVAIRTDKGVIMGGDSCSGNPRTYDSYRVVQPVKVAKVGEFLIGYTSSWRMGQILHHVIAPIKHDPREDIYHEIITKLVPILRKTFKDEGYVETEKGMDYGGTFLIAHGKRIFTIHSDFCVLECSEPFDACGCGEVLARGALHALDVANHKKPKTFSPQEMLEISLQTAERYNAFVRGPFHYVQNY